MVIKYKLDYSGGDEYAYLISKILKDKNANVIKTGEQIIVYLEGDEEEIKSSFALLGETLPLSIYLGEQSVEEAAMMPPNRQPLREANYMAMYPKALASLITEGSTGYFTIEGSLFFEGGAADTPSKLETLLRGAASLLKKGDRLAIKNKTRSFALSLEPSSGAMLTNLNSTSLERFGITTDEALSLSAMERPFVLKLVDGEPMLFCFANDELTFLLSKCAYDEGIDALFISPPSGKEREISFSNTKMDAPKREILSFVRANRFFVNTAFAPTLVDGPALFFDLGLHEDFGIYAIKAKTVSKKILSPSFPDKNPLLEIEKRFDFGKKLVKNFKNSFKNEAEALESVEYSKSDIENFLLALSLSLSQKECFFSLVSSANGSPIDRGVKLTFLQREDKKLDLLRCLYSIFRLPIYQSRCGRSAKLPLRSVRIDIEGVVQGVGFRPFVARLALKLDLKGSVKNSSLGVSIVVCGSDLSIKHFLEELKTNPPPLSKIDKITVNESAYRAFDGFLVEESFDSGLKNALFPPDLTICKECERELFDPENRRFLYPLINCQNCGPRFTVIESLPYDRSRTTMRFFEMCEECRSEYKNILNRRFHAEPISCPSCGPSFYFTDERGGVLESSKTGKILKYVATALNEGKIVAMKGVGGFHLLCRADSDEAVKRLREKKRRAKKPLAVMFGSIDALRQECTLSEYEENLITSKERPITILKKSPSYSLSRHISYDSPFVGAFLPYNGIYAILFYLIDFPLVATSANISDEPIITDEKELFARLSGVFDYALYYDRAIVQGCDDSVVRASEDTLIKIRNSRGYAPSFFKTSPFASPVFCAGAHQKNCFAVCFDENIAVSSHIGDLNSLEAVEYYEKSVEHMRSLWNLSFSLAVCDKNNRYASSAYASSLGIQTLKIQHHKAHFLASLFEKDMLHRDAVGIVWDGAGLGDDGSVWGGEIFVKNGYDISRASHIPQFWLFGGERAAKEPRKAALSLALSFLGEEESYDVAMRLGFSKAEIEVIFDAFSKKINCIQTTSMGRVFDAVAALVGVVQNETYEGESGLMLESLYQESCNKRYGAIEDMGQLLRDILKERDKTAVATKFINSLSFYIKRVSKEYDLPIFCSGGVFQNSALIGAMKRDNGASRLFFHEKLSPNDSSICVGQAAFASLYLGGYVTKEEF